MSDAKYIGFTTDGEGFDASGVEPPTVKCPSCGWFGGEAMAKDSRCPECGTATLPVLEGSHIPPCPPGESCYWCGQFGAWE